MKQSFFLCSVFVCILSTGVFAAVTSFTDRDSFNAEGIITYNYGFEDYSTTNFSYPNNPFTRDGVTYTTGSNLVIGSGTGYAPLSNVFCYDGWTPLSGNVEAAPQFTMFGFDLGYLGAQSLIDLQVTTNLDTYSFRDLSVPIASQGLNFYGFTTGGGEYFTGLLLSSQYGSGSAPAIDNVTLGHTQISAVPVPSSLLLAGIGIIGVGKLLRKRH